MTPPEPVPATPPVGLPVSAWADQAYRERTRRTRRRLLLAAATLFDEHGYRGAAVSDILDTAGLTKGALYFHFRSKQALAEALLDEVEASWAVIVAELGRRDADPLWRLLLETDAYVARWMYDPLVRGISRAINDSDLRHRRVVWLTTWESDTATLLQRAAADGLLSDHTDPRRAARAVVGLAMGNYTLADGPEDMWTRMSESWEGLLPIMTTSEWHAGWAASGWADRPRPVAARYREALLP